MKIMEFAFNVIGGILGFAVGIWWILVGMGILIAMVVGIMKFATMGM